MPTRPSRVPREVYEDGPTAIAMRLARQVFVVAAATDSATERHAVDMHREPGSEGRRTLCGEPVDLLFPKAALLIVECAGCLPHMPLPDDYS